MVDKRAQRNTNQNPTKIKVKFFHIASRMPISGTVAVIQQHTYVCARAPRTQFTGHSLSSWTTEYTHRAWLGLTWLGGKFIHIYLCVRYTKESVSRCLRNCFVFFLFFCLFSSWSVYCTCTTLHYIFSLHCCRFPCTRYTIQFWFVRYDMEQKWQKNERAPRERKTEKMEFNQTNKQTYASIPNLRRLSRINAVI